jgi:hypothetical protein
MENGSAHYFGRTVSPAISGYRVDKIIYLLDLMRGNFPWALVRMSGKD